jgi:hypothetical protein
MVTGFYGAFGGVLTCADTEPSAGPSFWDQKLLTFTRLENVDWIASRVPNLPINTSFMIFAGVALAFNIVTRCVRSIYLHRLLMLG